MYARKTSFLVVNHVAYVYFHSNSLNQENAVYLQSVSRKF